MEPKHQVVKITPELATKLLEHNYKKNRNISRERVRFLSKAMKNGEWTFNPNPITVSTAGEVIDGQHRLHAVISSGVSVEMCLMTGVESGVFKNIDSGMRRRPADSLGISVKIVEVVKAIIIYGTGYHRFVSNSLIEKVYSLFAEELVEFHKTFTLSKKGLTNGPIRLAAIISILNGADKGHVYDTYHSIIHLDFKNMTPVSQLFVKKVVEMISDSDYRIARQGAGYVWHRNTFTMAMDVFNPEKANAGKLVVTQNKIDEAVSLVRKIVLRESVKKGIPTDFSEGV